MFRERKQLPSTFSILFQENFSILLSLTFKWCINRSSEGVLCFALLQTITPPPPWATFQHENFLGPSNWLLIMAMKKKKKKVYVLTIFYCNNMHSPRHMTPPSSSGDLSLVTDNKPSLAILRLHCGLFLVQKTKKLSLKIIASALQKAVEKSSKWALWELYLWELCEAAPLRSQAFFDYRFHQKARQINNCLAT